MLFLSADTGGGHRASAEALAKQFLIQYPGSTYELADLWTDHGCLPYRTLVNSYKHLSANPRQWRLFFHLTNNNVNEFFSQIHSKFMCGKAIKNRIAAFEPDVVVSVHPTMNHCPRVQVRKISKEQGKHIPFFTVVTDLGSAHITWFDKGVNKVYVASDRLSKLARKMKFVDKFKNAQHEVDMDFLRHSLHRQLSQEQFYSLLIDMAIMRFPSPKYSKEVSRHQFQFQSNSKSSLTHTTVFP